ncbi:MAG: DnaJ domain-containing protein, partial [Planctomycetia bacterium]|nr:DnaJ domain-containing protein [Planctomycetia bacterium]
SLYRDLFEDPDRAPEGWASVLGVSPPFDPQQVRAAYRARSRAAHPDAGGTDAEFVRLREAYEEALAYFAGRGF